MKTTRRNFLRVSALAGGGFMMTIPMLGSDLLEDAADATLDVPLNNFLTIDESGSITFILTKHEMGQGSGTGLPMILAEELDADWSRVRIERSPYDPKFSGREMGTTGGSSTISKMWDVLREAGATGRKMLMQAAAKQWSVPIDQLNTKEGFVINTLTNERLSYGELAEAASRSEVPEEVTYKEPEEYTLIGKPIQNLITDGVVTGNGNYGVNVEVPGMVYAAIERCPVYLGKLRSFDDAGARNVAGVLDVFPIPKLDPVDPDHHIQEGVVVVATSTWAAFKGKKALKVSWEEGVHRNATLEKLSNAMHNVPREELQEGYTRGDLAELQEDESVEWIEGAYDNPYQAHALMEPINATVHFQGDSCEVWVGTQSGQRVIQEVAKITGLKEEDITIHVLNSGGSFGRRFYVDSSMEATFISKKIGKPVKLTWTREDEIRHDYVHPFHHSIHKAGIKDGNVIGWETTLVRTNPWFSGDNYWEIPYDFPNVQTYTKVVDSIVPTGAWRSVSEHSSALGQECFMDELARKLNADPLDLRLSLMAAAVEKEGNDDFAQRVFDYRSMLRTRYQNVLNYAKDKGLMTSAAPGKGVGFAIFNFGRTVCAHIAEVSSDSALGIKVNKVTSILECGTVVNPHFAKGQVEGSVIWALSALYFGGFEVENGVPTRTNFHNNRLLRIDETPLMDVHFIPSDEPPSGLGEPATPPLAPAVLNAIYDLTGERIREIPIRRGVQVV